MDLNNLDEYINKLNDEQKEAALYENGSVLVLAAAGSGKTSTLTCRIAFLIGKKKIPSHNILAVTFTNKAAKEMNIRLQKMGVETKNLWIGTFHGICNRILRYHAVEAGIQKNFYIMDQQEQLSFLKRVCRANGYDPKVINVDDLQDKINGYKEVGWRSDQLRIGSQERNLYELYEQACKKDNCVDFAELMLGCYEIFKKYPHIADAYAEKFQHILVDEFQDTSELQYKWLKILALRHKNLFAVGDDDQCLALGTKVLMADRTYKNIENINVGEEVISKIGTTSLNKKVVNVFKKQHDGEMIEITLNDSTKLLSTPEHNWFANFSKKFSPQKYFTYLMYKKFLGFRIGVSRVHSNSQNEIALLQRAKHEHADKIWVLGCYDKEDYSRYNEIKLSLEYGIPTTPFVARKKKSEIIETVVSNQNLLNKLFNELKTHDKGYKLLKDLNLSFENPLHIPRSRNSNRNNISITLCDSLREDKALHILEYFTNSIENKSILEKNGFILESHKKDNCYRLRKASREYGSLVEIGKKIQSLLEDASIIYKAKISNKRFNQIFAKDILPGMIMCNENNEEKVVVDVKRIQMNTTVYDLNIENTHNFIANGITTHNSIYSFRGARPENLNYLKKDFNAITIKIEKNYRSDAYILKAANAIIAKNSNRQGKNLVPTRQEKQMIGLYNAFNDEQESGYVASEIKRLRRTGIPYKNMAILYRTNGQSRSLEKAMNSMSIPYIIYGGFRFFDRQEVKHAMAYLRLANNKHDNMAFLRVANIPARAIGDTALKKLDAFAQEEKLSLYDAVKASDSKTQKKYQPFIDVIDKLESYCEGKRIPEMVKLVIVNSGLEEMYEKDKKEGEERLDNLYELISAAEVFVSETPNAHIDEFLAFSTLESNIESNKRDENADAIKMMTVHSSKGLEFDIVFLTGMEESLFPHANSLAEPTMIEEERRLMYVAVTRAKDVLYITNCEERLIHGQRNHFIKSRFVKEIPLELVTKLN